MFTGDHAINRYPDIATPQSVPIRGDCGLTGRDGTPVDTPIWFVIEGRTALFRTKIGPKTRRLQARGDVQLTACDHRGTPQGAAVPGRARILSGDAAQQGNTALHPALRLAVEYRPAAQDPGRDQCAPRATDPEKLRRARHRGLWPDSAIVAVDL